MTRVIQSVAVTIPFLITLAVGLGGGEWSKDLWPVWAWVVLTIGAVVSTLVWGVSKRAYELEKRLLPQIAICELGIWDDNGEQYVRVQAHNPSTEKLCGLKARIESISDSVGALAVGETLDPQDGQSCRLDYPIQLFTQEWLRRRLAGGDQFTLPFDLAADEKKWVEIFQVTNPFGKQIHIFGSAKREDLVTPEDMTFECVIHGVGAPVQFSVEYEAAKHSDAFVVRLKDSGGNILDTKEFAKEE